MKTSFLHLQSTPIRLPENHCVLCGKSIEDVGGKRIVAQKYRGITISDKPIKQSGNADYIRKSVRVTPLSLHLILWGKIE